MLGAALLAIAVRSAPVPGGAGHAAYFQWTRPSVLSVQWIEPPSGDMTVE